MKLMAAAVVAVVPFLVQLTGAVGTSFRRQGLPAESSASNALQRVEAVEDVRSSRVLCRMDGGPGDGFATVRLHTDNARSLVFNDDVKGVETKVRCSGAADQSCSAAAAQNPAHKIEDCPTCPCEAVVGQLYGAYSIAMAKEVDGRCGKGGDTGLSPRVLLLGLGGGELATHMATHCSGLQIDSVELDGRLPELALRYFGMPPEIKVTVGDAGPVAISLAQAVAENALLADEKKYDVVLVDCFSTGGVTPEHCRTPEFIRALHTLTRNEGKVLHHLWHTDPDHPEVASEFAATVALYKQEFVCPGCKVDVGALGFGDNVGPDSIVYASIPAADA